MKASHPNGDFSSVDNDHPDTTASRSSNSSPSRACCYRTIRVVKVNSAEIRHLTDDVANPLNASAYQEVMGNIGDPLSFLMVQVTRGCIKPTKQHVTKWRQWSPNLNKSMSFNMIASFLGINSSCSIFEVIQASTCAIQGIVFVE